MNPTIKNGSRVWINDNWKHGIVECFEENVWNYADGNGPHYGVRVDNDYLVWVPKQALENNNQG